MYEIIEIAEFSLKMHKEISNGLHVSGIKQKETFTKIVNNAALQQEFEGQNIFRILLVVQSLITTELY